MFRWEIIYLSFSGFCHSTWRCSTVSPPLLTASELLNLLQSRFTSLKGVCGNWRVQIMMWSLSLYLCAWYGHFISRCEYTFPYNYTFEFQTRDAGQFTNLQPCSLNCLSSVFCLIWKIECGNCYQLRVVLMSNISFQLSGNAPLLFWCNFFCDFIAVVIDSVSRENVMFLWSLTGILEGSKACGGFFFGLLPRLVFGLRRRNAGSLVSMEKVRPVDWGVRDMQLFSTDGRIWYISWL